LPTLRKNESNISLSLHFPHAEAEHIASGLKTESDFTEADGNISISITANNFSDLRAIWNSTMRGIIASEQALNAIKESGD
jgi:tRNA threonylcarbamoyladenosine modification (KEOPS) complex  Pcc1 subunit